MTTQQPLSSTIELFPSHADAPASLKQAPELIRLPPGVELTYQPCFYAEQESVVLLNELLQATPWRQDTLRFGAKDVAVPRLQAWYGDKRYGYSGLSLSPLPWTETLDAIRSRLSAYCGLRFNSVLLNFYRNGQDSVAWHSDDERELGPDPHIASLSFGATRRFELRHRQRKESKRSMLLHNGSLLLMGTGLQQHWHHQLPKDAAVDAPRLNLTFRFIH